MCRTYNAITFPPLTNINVPFHCSEQVVIFNNQVRSIVMEDHIVIELEQELIIEVTDVEEEVLILQ